MYDIVIFFLFEKSQREEREEREREVCQTERSFTLVHDLVGNYTFVYSSTFSHNYNTTPNFSTIPGLN